MASQANFHQFLMLISIIFLFFPILNDSQPASFSVDLIHSDSPISPLFDPSITPSDRLTNSFRRSISRASHLNQILTNDTILSEGHISTHLWGYLMRLSIGKPPHEMLAFFDSTTDLTWIQCTPCDNCFKRNLPPFNRSSSETYKDLPCKSLPCKNLEKYDTIHISCNKTTDSVCRYQTDYIYGASSSGDLAIDMLTLSSNGNQVQFPKTLFGCSHNNSGPFPEVVSGIVGFGGGSLSIVNQLEQSIYGKFSYCLAVTHDTPSKLNFGSSAVVSGAGVVSTPLVSDIRQTLHRITLTGIVVKTRSTSSGQSGIWSIQTVSDDPQDGNNLILDSSTTITLLTITLYNVVEAMVRDAIEGTPVSDPPAPLTLCYKLEDQIVGPSLILNFTGGAEVELAEYNSFVFLETPKLVCWAVAPTADRVGVLGSLAQINFLVGYDLFKKRVSFKPVVCGDQ